MLYDVLYDLHRLSPSLANEVAAIFHRDVIKSVPLLRDHPHRDRFASALHPEV
jgi:hypothetical protein